MPKVAVLASGTGTNLEAILSAGIPVALVVTDRLCRAMEIAKTAGLETTLIDRRHYGYAPGADWNRNGFTRAITDLLLSKSIDLTALAGFMTILSPGLFTRFHGPILNTHPSLLPRFKGAHAVPLALASGVKETGCTVHIATPKTDSGEILGQIKVPVLPNDDATVLHERIKKVERVLYPKVILEVIERLGNHDVE